MLTLLPRLAASLLLAVSPARLALQEEVFSRPDFGFTIEVPGDWARLTEGESQARLDIAFVPRDGREMKLKLGVERLVAGSGSSSAASTLRATLQFLEQGGYEGVTELTTRIAGRDLPGFAMELDGEGKRWWLRRSFLEHEGFLFTLETVALAEKAEEYEPAFDVVWSGLELVELSAEAARARDLAAIGARCGSEVDWAADWDAAARRARETARLVLVTAHVYPGFAVPDDSMLGTFMDQDIIALVNARYVPLKLGPERAVPFADHELYGLSGTTFGKAVLLVTPGGAVLDERIEASYDFLRTAADQYGSGRSTETEPDGQPLERARYHLDRGEHARARELLRDQDSAQALRLEADILRREKRGAEALALLTAARAAEGGEDLALQLDLETSSLLMLSGHEVQALALARDVEQRAETGPERSQALFLVGALARKIEGHEAAGDVWRELVASDPEVRWSWQAAALLGSPYWEIDIDWKLAWPAEDIRDLFEPEGFQPLRVSEAPRARADALAWLLAHQREDGEWPVPGALAREDGEPANDFVLATQAFCVQALLDEREGPEAQAALDRALTALVRGYREAQEAGGKVYYMDYGVWSRSCVINALVDAWEAGALEREILDELVPLAVDELASKQIDGTGWSYYVTGSLDSGKTNPSRPISFTTAAVVLALQRARGAGLEVPAEVLNGGLDQLTRMRGNTTFQYMTGADGKASAPDRVDPGAAGRAPLCMLALYRAGRADEDDLARALETYSEYAHTLTKELGKGLMHTGPEAQGSHYVLFDHYWAAQAILELPEEQRARFKTVVLNELLQARTKAGYFYDNASDGFAWGTAAAVRVIECLTSDS